VFSSLHAPIPAEFTTIFENLITTPKAQQRPRKSLSPATSNATVASTSSTVSTLAPSLSPATIAVASGEEGGARELKESSESLDKEDKRIMVVEDNVVNYKVLTKWLRDAGYTSYEVAYNGLQALDLFIADPKFNVILMDISMPIMDGYTAAKKIREHEKKLNSGVSPRNHVPIIALTANASDNDKKKCLECGMDDYITKPIKSREVVLDMIAKHL
jgi:CheY-like chemotaxis protein